MRVLITGIDGFVGSHAAEYLLSIPGVEVHGTVLDDRLAMNIAHVRDSVHLHQLNILDKPKLAALFDKLTPDRILHLAGQAFLPNSFKNPVETFETNILGAVNLLEGARACQLEGRESPVVLIVSTGEVYGDVGSSASIAESMPFAPQNPYAASKASIDLIAQQYASGFGLDVIVARPFNHAGPRQSPLFVCSDFGRQFAQFAVSGKEPTLVVGNLDAARDFTDVRDVVRAYWMLLEKTSPEVVFNICSGKAVKIREIVGMYEKISGRKVRIRPSEERLRRRDIPLIVGSYDRLHTVTGWSPRIPLFQTLSDVFNYWSAVEVQETGTSPRTP